jgi:hypothetical protein
MNSRRSPSTLRKSILAPKKRLVKEGGDFRFGSLAEISHRNRHVRFTPECVAKLFAALRASNNRIEANGPLNQYCALAVDIESILRGRALKIVLQHIPPESRHSTA